MNSKIQDLVAGLKQDTETLIADIQYEGLGGEISEKALGMLLKIVELEQRCKQISIGGHPTNKSSSAELDLTEMNKVERRLKLWSRPDRQHQVNAKLLNLYLKLAERDEQVTVDQFREAYGDDAEFLQNYPQLKNISPKNHGKVFEEVNQVVSIWQSVEQYVIEYKDAISRN